MGNNQSTSAVRMTCHKLFFILIFLLGISVRVWQFGAIPAGLNVDEASSAVDSYYVLHYGMDRNGVSYPIQFIMYGSGQSSLHEYLLLPFVAFGLSTINIRLPMLLGAILTLPLFYFTARRVAGRRYALIAMFLLAISPWHIMMSRWALNDNLLPVFFLAGFLCLLKSSRDNYWFIASCTLFAICFYAYGSSYAAVPVFLLIAVPILLRFRRLSILKTILGIGILTLLSIPILLFIRMNLLGLDAIHLGPFTIPRFPIRPAYESLSALYANNPLRLIAGNLLVTLNLLITQTDGLIWNAIPQYGYFYKYTFPIELIGFIMLIARKQKDQRIEKWMVAAWIVGALFIGIQLQVNINRINLIFLPLLLCSAFPLEWLAQQSKPAFLAALCIFFVAFIFFVRDYFGAEYQNEIGQEFSAGFLPAIDFATHSGTGPICASDEVNMPYIYALIAEKPNPQDFLRTVKYTHPVGMKRPVRSFGRYIFGLNYCEAEPDTIYVLGDNELPPQAPAGYKETSFGYFNVYTP